MVDDERDDEDDDLDDEDDEDDEDDDDEDEEDGGHADALPRIEPERARAYKKTVTQLQTFHREISLISNKKPDSPLNEFKLGLINETLAKANFVLGDEFRPFPGFESFDVARLPSASDTVLILSHYIDGLHALRDRYCYGSHWRVTGDDDIQDDE